MHYQELKQAWTELTSAGQPFEIEEIDVRGSNVRSYKHAPPNIRAVWLSTMAFSDRDYLVYQDERITYGQAHEKVNAITAWLWSQGVRRGDRVAVAMRNYPEWMLLYWACVSIGVACVGMNAWWITDELEYGLKDSGPKVLFCDSERLARVMERPDMAEGITLVGVRCDTLPAGIVPYEEVIAGGGAMPDVDIDPDDDACIFYTSGTTGFPKGAQLTHRGCVANLMNMSFSAQVQGLATMRATGIDPASVPAPNPPVGLITTPLFHVTANNCAAYVATASGGTMVLMYKWDAGEALRLIETEKVTAMSGVPTMAREVITHPDFATTDTSSLLTLGGGGAQLQPDLVAKIDASVPTARPNTGYGMTETCGIITAVSADFFVDKPASCGPAMPTFEARCVDDEGNFLPVGEMGELWVKGAPVIKGYLNRPEATADAIRDGWFNTGDIARIDEDGFIYIVDRAKDMVLRGGENVYCSEVETAIYHHDAVAEAAVFGIPDDRLGEEVAAAIVLHPGASLSEDELRAFLAERIAKHKIPAKVWFLTEQLPRNANGKFLKRELRKQLAGV